MAGFASLDKRMMRDVNRIHDFLWVPGWTGLGEALLANLEREGRELDEFLDAGGRLGKHARALVAGTRKDKERHGSPLYELLYDTYNLTAATEHVRKRDFKGAAEHASWVVESDSIGTCVALNAFPLVEEWEGGKIEFEVYASRLADLLQGKGVPGVGQYKRMLLSARTFGKEWSAKASEGQHVLAGRTAIEVAAWVSVASRSARSAAVGRAPQVPIRDYAAIVEKIVSRL